jgi:hypothetical protein
VVILDKIMVNPVSGKDLTLPGFHEESAFVAKHLGFDNDHLSNPGRYKLHAASFFCPCRSCLEQVDVVDWKRTCLFPRQAYAHNPREALDARSGFAQGLLRFTGSPSIHFLDIRRQLKDNCSGQLIFRPPDCRRPESVTTSWIRKIVVRVRSTDCFSLATVRQGKEFRLRLLSEPLSAPVE